MDKELAELHDLARNMLIDVQTRMMSGDIPEGFTKSDLKRVRKALSNIDFNPEDYADIMEDIATGKGGPKDLMKRVRNMENNVMKAFELLDDDTIHHLVQQRTGGDFGIQTKGSVVRGAIKRLEDRFGMKFGQSSGAQGVVRGDTAFSNFAHKSDDKATGLERQSGIGKNPDPTKTAHRYGVQGYAKDLTAAETADEKALAEALGTRIEAQIEDVKTGIKTDSPRVEAIRKLDPGLQRAYMPDNTAEEIAGMKKIIKGLPDSPILSAYRQLARVPGGRSAFAAIPFIGDAFGAADAAEREVKAAKTGNPVDEIQSQLAGAGQIPVLGAVPDLANSVIDMFRAGYHHRKIRGRSGAQKALQAR
jgi:hypothetical protein